MKINELLIAMMEIKKYCPHPRRQRLTKSRRHPIHPFKFVIFTILVALHLSSFHVKIVLQRVDAAVEDEASENEEAIQEMISDDYHYHQKDLIEDSLFDPLAVDPSCTETEENDCYSPPKSTIEEEIIFDPTCFKGAGDEGGIDDSDETVTKNDLRTQQRNQQCAAGKATLKRDKHWGDDPKTINMRDQLREQAKHSITDRRPPIFLLPGLASTRLVAWKFKKCAGALSSDIKIQDNVWLNINLVIKMGTTIDIDCMKQCLELGLNQSDFKTDKDNIGCKLRPDEGLDAIASLAPGGIGAELLVGGTNTVYSWLIQWLAENLGYDVTTIIGLPYDWRLTPSVMETRDGFLTMTRKRIEAAVKSNKHPGIMVAHSMGNVIFRYFIEWLRVELREEAYDGYVKRAKRRTQNLKKQKQQHQQYQQKQQNQQHSSPQNKHEGNASSWTSSYMPGWVTGIVADVSAEVDDWYDWFIDENGQATKKKTGQINENEPVGPSNDNENDDDSNNNDDDKNLNAQFWELAKFEGDEKWIEWLETHIWTYVGLSAPMLGAINPLRAVISGENMGLPVNDDIAREMELTFGSTHTLNPVSTNSGFCDDRDIGGWGDEPMIKSEPNENESTLACLDDVMNDIEYSSAHRDPWKNFPALKALLRDRIDWVTGRPMIDIDIVHCNSNSTKNKNSCEVFEKVNIGAKEVEDGSIFQLFNNLWREKESPLIVKKEQLEDSYVKSRVKNILQKTWDRPLIKHVIMAYGIDIPTEVGYVYSKVYNVEHSKNGGKSLIDRNETEIPSLKTVVWENPRGLLSTQPIEASRGSIGEYFMKKKSKREPLEPTVPEARLQHSGDGSVPYISLSWAQTWLLHATRARRFTKDKHKLNETDAKNALDFIGISYRPKGESDWIEGPAPEEWTTHGNEEQKADSDTGTNHPHGTRYKPLMKRYHNVGKSRTTGIIYTTSVIEAIGVEHKETTRNFDILAAVFTEVLNYMHDDLGLISNKPKEYAE